MHLRQASDAFRGGPFIAQLTIAHDHARLEIVAVEHLTASANNDSG